MKRERTAPHTYHIYTYWWNLSVFAVRPIISMIIVMVFININSLHWSCEIGHTHGASKQERERGCNAHQLKSTTILFRLRLIESLWGYLDCQLQVASRCHRLARWTCSRVCVWNNVFGLVYIFFFLLCLCIHRATVILFAVVVGGVSLLFLLDECRASWNQIECRGWTECGDDDKN